MEFEFNVGLKSLLKQGLSEPEFYRDLVYKFRKNVGRNDFSGQFRENIIIRYKRTGYNMVLMRQTAYLVVNPVTVNNVVVLFNCMPAGRALGLMKLPALKLSIKFVGTRCSIFGWTHRGSTAGFFVAKCGSCR